MDTIYRELFSVAAGLLTGLFLMAVYDVLRLLRFFIRHSSFWTGLEDFTYWIFSAVICFCLLFRQNEGEMRIYIIASVFIGMVFYDKTVSRIFFTLLKKVKKYLKMKKK